MHSGRGGVTTKTATDLVGSHPHSRVRTKIEVFDWLVKNEDKRVGKNPAGYLVASIRSDYQTPEDYTKSTAKAKTVAKETKVAEEDRKQKRKAKEDADRAKKKEIFLRDRWEKLPESEARCHHRQNQSRKPQHRPFQKHA